MKNKLNDLLLSEDEIKEIQLKNEVDKKTADQTLKIIKKILSKRYKKANINSDVVTNGYNKVKKLESIQNFNLIVLYFWFIPIGLIFLLFFMAIVMYIHNIPIRRDISFYIISGLIMIFSGFMVYRTHKFLIIIKNNLQKINRKE